METIKVRILEIPDTISRSEQIQIHTLTQKVWDYYANSKVTRPTAGNAIDGYGQMFNELRSLYLAMCDNKKTVMRRHAIRLAARAFQIAAAIGDENEQ